MELNITPLQALQNNKSRRQHHTPEKRRQNGNFAALLGLYTAMGSAVKRQDGFNGKSAAAPLEKRPAQSDMNLLLRQIYRVNKVISAMME